MKMKTFMLKVRVRDKETGTSQSICLFQNIRDVENFVQATERKGYVCAISKYIWKTEIEEMEME